MSQEGISLRLAHDLLDILYLKDREKYEEVSSVIMRNFRSQCSHCDTLILGLHQEQLEHLREFHREMLEALQLNIESLILGASNLTLLVPGLEGGIQGVRVHSSNLLRGIGKDVLQGLYQSLSMVVSSLVRVLMEPGTSQGTEVFRELEKKIGSSYPALLGNLEDASQKITRNDGTLNINLLDSIVTHLRLALSDLRLLLERRRGKNEEFVLIRG